MRVVLMIQLLIFVACSAARGEQQDDWTRRMHSTNSAIRLASAYDFGEDNSRKRKTTLAALASDTHDPDQFVRAHAMLALSQATSAKKSVVPILTKALFDLDGGIRLNAALALSNLGPDGLAPLLKVLREGDNSFPEYGSKSHALTYQSCGDAMYLPSFAAAIGVGRIGPKALPGLIDAAERSTRKPAANDDIYHRSYSTFPFLNLAVQQMGDQALAPIVAEMQKRTGPVKDVLAAVLRSSFSHPNSVDVNLFTGLLLTAETRDYAAGVLGGQGDTGIQLVLDHVQATDEAAQLIILKAFAAAPKISPNDEKYLLDTAERYRSNPKIREAVFEVLDSRSPLSDKAATFLLKGALDTDKEVAGPAWNAIYRVPVSVAAVEAARADFQAALARNEPDSHDWTEDDHARPLLEAMGQSASPLIGDIVPDADRLASLPARQPIQDSKLYSDLAILSQIAPAEALRILTFIVRQNESELQNESALTIIERLKERAAPLAPLLTRQIATRTKLPAASRGCSGDASSTCPYLITTPSSQNNTERIRELQADALAAMGKAGQQELISLCNSPPDLGRDVACSALARHWQNAEELRAVLERIRTTKDPAEAKRLTDALSNESGYVMSVEERSKYQATHAIAAKAAEADVHMTLPVLEQMLSETIVKDDKYRQQSILEIVSLFGFTAEEMTNPIIRFVESGKLEKVDDDVLARTISSITPKPGAVLEIELRAGRANGKLLNAATILSPPAKIAPEAIEPLLGNPNPNVRAAALTLFLLQNPDASTARKVLLPLLNDKNLYIAIDAAEYLLVSDAQSRDRVVEALARYAVSADEALQRRASLSLINQTPNLSDLIKKVLTTIAIDQYLQNIDESTKRQFYNAWFKRCVSGTITSLPPFPWPPPRFSDRNLVPRNLLGGDNASLKQVDEKIVKALQENGVLSTGVFRITGGFARVTRMEHIDATGTPLSGDARWTNDTLPPRDLLDYLGLLFLQRPGHYRFFVFAVTNTWAPPTKEIITYSEADVLYQSGRPELTEDIGKLSFKDRQCYVLVYDFDKNGNAATQVVPSKVDVQTQLIRTGIWAKLSVASTK